MSLKNSKQVQLLFILAFSLFMYGCGTTSMNVLQDYKLKPDDNKGLVIISTSWISAAPFEKVAFMPGLSKTVTNNINEAMGNILNVNNTFIEHDFTDPPGYFYIMELEAGSYEVFHKTMMVNSIRFDVIPGEIVYIGGLEFRYILGCMQTPGTGCEPDKYNYVVPAVTNQWDRDKALMQQRLKNYKPDSVNIRLANIQKD